LVNLANALFMRQLSIILQAVTGYKKRPWLKAYGVRRCGW